MGTFALIIAGVMLGWLLLGTVFALILGKVIRDMDQ